MDDSIFTKQYYSKYTDEDQEVWKMLFDSQWEYLKSSLVASRWFYDGIRILNLTGDSIPKFTDINTILNKYGWKIKAVKGIVDDAYFFQLLREKTFPVTTWLRSKDNIDYLEEPDMFHDLFGHVPFLVHEQYLNFLERMAIHAEKVFKSGDKEREYRMSRFYWYTVEFGLIRRSVEKYDIYGAGILSSFQETQKAISSESEKKYFNYDMLSERFTKSELQPFYAYLRKDLKFINSLNVEEI